MPYWDTQTDKILYPALLIVPTSFVQDNIREIIIDNQPRVFDWFNINWSPRFKHSLTPFSPKVISLGVPTGINTRSIHIYGAKTEKRSSNTTKQNLKQIIEIITGIEQLGEIRASDYALTIIAQNYTEAIQQIFDEPTIGVRLLKGFPEEQPKLVGSGESITYISGGRLAQRPSATVTTEYIKTDISLTEDNKPIARSQILLDINLNIPKTQLDFS